MKLKVKNKCEILFLTGKEVITELSSINTKLVFFASKSVQNYVNNIVNGLRKLNKDVYVYLTSDGEENKNLDKAVMFTQYLALNNISRKDVIVNIGGGTLCDLGAFVASIYMRGINYINIPTTLLCAVDAAVGGKTAIDVAGEKNLWGTFNQPSKVIIDSDMLNNMPKNLVEDGLSEIVKYAIIDGDFENFLQKTELVSENLTEIVFECLKIKCAIVEIDEYDLNQRKTLNLGHTVAHAIEVNSNYKINHASAVAIGLAIETKIAFYLNFISKERYNSIINLCNKHLNIDFDCVDYSLLLKFMSRDKKNEGEKIAFSLPTESGVEVKFFTKEEIEKVLKNII